MAKGPNKAEILAEFVKTMNSAMFSMQADDPKPKEDNIDRIRL
jgi:hypothetical protein